MYLFIYNTQPLQNWLITGLCCALAPLTLIKHSYIRTLVPGARSLLNAVCHSFLRYYGMVEPNMAHSINLLSNRLLIFSQQRLSQTNIKFLL